MTVATLARAWEMITPNMSITARRKVVLGVKRRYKARLEDLMKPRVIL
jgi:hypothetical protein